MAQPSFDYMPLVVGFVLWTAFSAWLMWRQSSQLTLRTIFQLTTGFAVIAMLGSPAGQALIRRIRYVNELRHWVTLLVLLSLWVLATTIFRRTARRERPGDDRGAPPR